MSSGDANQTGRFVLQVYGMGEPHTVAFTAKDHRQTEKNLSTPVGSYVVLTVAVLIQAPKRHGS